MNFVLIGLSSLGDSGLICEDLMGVIFAGVDFGIAVVAVFVLDGGSVVSEAAFCTAKNGVFGVLSMAGGAGSLGGLGREVVEIALELDDEVS